MELRRAIDWVERWGMLPAGCTVLCAVSGGRDSMVLLHFLYELSRRRGFSVAAAHYNHHLRPTADRDEQFVRAWAQARKIPCRCGGGDVAAWCAARGLSTEEGARQLRYEFLEEARRELGADVIATGHHLADQAETVLLNLLRGTGPEGLRGIAPVHGRLIRPLLDTSPEELAAYAAAHGIPWVEDETNADPAYTRNRLRAQVLPVLRELNSAALENIHRAARTVAEEDGWMEAEAARRLEAMGEAVPYEAFRAQPLALRRRMARLLLDRLGTGKKDITAAHIDGVAALGRGEYLNLPGGVYAAVEDGCLTVAEAKPPAPAVPLTAGQAAVWDGWRVTLATEEKNCPGTHILRLPADRIEGTLAIGPWNPAARLETATGLRSFKRVFADYRVPVSRRNQFPVLYAGERPLAILSLTEGCPAGCMLHRSHLLLEWSKKREKEDNQVWEKA